MLEEAAAVDAAEDAEFGAARGDELPEALQDPTARAAAIAAALEEIKAQEAASRATGKGTSSKSSSSTSSGKAEGLAERIELLTAELGTQRAAQAAAIETHERTRAAARAAGTPIWGGARPKSQTARMRDLAEQLQRTKAQHEQELRADADREAARAVALKTRFADKALGDEVRKVNLTDPQSRLMPTRKGFVQGYNVQFAVTDDQLIVGTEATQDPTDYGAFLPMVQAAQDAAARMHSARRDSDPIGADVEMVLADAGYLSVKNLTAPGPDRLIAVDKRRSLEHDQRHDPVSGPPPAGAGPIDAMSHRLRTEDGIRDYRRRGATVEPAIGSIKHRLGLRTLSRRGLTAAHAEVTFTAMIHNLLKLRQAAT